MQTIQRAVRRTLAAAAVLTVASSAALAQAKTPDFTGQWELNQSKSDLGPMAGMLTKLTFTVKQDPATFSFIQAVSTPQGDQTSPSQDFTLDGKEATVAGPQGMSIVKSAKWAADTLLISGKVQGTDQGTSSRWTLSPDGKSLYVQQQMSGPMGAMSMKLVFDKK